MDQVISLRSPHVAISQDEREFFVQLGARMAQLRKQSGITQVQLAEALELSQAAITAYESGTRRVPVSMLPTLARILGVSVEELIGEQPSAAARKRGPAPKFQQQLERISALPKSKQKFVMQVLETVLQQQAR